MKNIILLILVILLTGCKSNSTPENLSMKNAPLGWSENGNNMTFNTGNINYDFDGSPVGKLYNYFFEEEEEYEFPEIKDIPLVETKEKK